MWKRLQNVYSQIKPTRLKTLTHPIWQPPPLHPVSYQPTTHRRILPFPVRVFIIGEDSIVITSRQFDTHSWLQCDFQCLAHSVFLESIMLFSRCSKDSLYPASRSRATPPRFCVTLPLRRLIFLHVFSALSWKHLTNFLEKPFFLPFFFLGTLSQDTRKSRWSRVGTSKIISDFYSVICLVRWIMVRLGKVGREVVKKNWLSVIIKFKLSWLSTV